MAAQDITVSGHRAIFGQRDPFKRHENITWLDPGLISRRTGFYRCDPDTRQLIAVADRFAIDADGVNVDAGAQLLDNRQRLVARDGKRLVRFAVTGIVDADNASILIDQGATRVAGVDISVMLQHLAHRGPTGLPICLFFGNNATR